MWDLMKKKIFISIVVTIFLLAGCVLGAMFYVKSLFTPANPSQTEAVTIEIPLGSNSTTIANILVENGLIKNALGFKAYTKWADTDPMLAGTYQLSPSMSMEEIVAVLKGNQVKNLVEYKLAIPEGLQLVEIAERIATFINGDADAVLAELNDTAFLQEITAGYPTEMTEGIFKKGTRHALEGYLFPATYFFYEDPGMLGLKMIVKPMLDETEKVYNEYMAQATEKGFTFHELLTLSSLIEEEATAKVDREKISSVFYNRLAISMPLQTDPTVLYAMGKHKDRVLYKDLEIVSPYNTYQNTGLPIGPISNSGISSVEAALNPKDTNYLYFLANKDGEVFFAEDFDEHKRLKEQHIDSFR